MAYFSIRAITTTSRRLRGRPDDLGKFHLIERLLTQVARVMDINYLGTLDPDVVHAALQMLAVGAAQ